MTYPEALFKSVLEADREAVVLCALDHTIVYMNPAAIRRYEKWGGAALVGKSLLDCHNGRSRGLIGQVVDWFRASADHDLVYTFYNEKENKDVYMAALRDDGGELIGYYEKQVHRDRETMKLYDLW
jgi:PAS domain-containing protein